MDQHAVGPELADRAAHAGQGPGRQVRQILPGRDQRQIQIRADADEIQDRVQHLPMLSGDADARVDSTCEP